MVFSPSLALMANQISYLQSRGFVAKAFNSETDDDDRQEIIEKLQQRASIDFLFLTPEMFYSPHQHQLRTILYTLLKNGVISMVVFDEAHLIQDAIAFRPLFEKIGELRKDFENVQFVALTTISQQMLPSLADALNMNLNNVEFINAPIARENIFYDVLLTDNVATTLVESIFEFSEHAKKGFSGIIYVDRNEDAEQFAKFLEHGENMNAESYYSDKPGRFEIQQKWMEGKIQILVATTESFGLGIVKHNVTFVIHLCRPIMRAFYQESGRAGVDGKIAFSRIITKASICYDEINGYLQTKECRRRYISSFFGEKGADCVAKCDNCVDKYTGLE